MVVGRYTKMDAAELAALRGDPVPHPWPVIGERCYRGCGRRADVQDDYVTNDNGVVGSNYCAQCYLDLLRRAHQRKGRE